MLSSIGLRGQLNFRLFFRYSTSINQLIADQQVKSMVCKGNSTCLQGSKLENLFVSMSD